MVTNTQNGTNNKHDKYPVYSCNDSEVFRIFVALGMIEASASILFSWAIFTSKVQLDTRLLVL